MLSWPAGAGRKNGIEYFYPETILAEIFGAGDSIQIEGDIVSRNGISMKKVELAERVVSRVDRDSVHNSDFERLLLAPIRAKLAVN